jgi:hypothetical protein
VPEFSGFPEAALDFYDDLEMDNTKTFWEAHKETYATAVAAPMKALTAALTDEFGEAKIFRPYRDVRFAKVQYLRPRTNPTHKRRPQRNRPPRPSCWSISSDRRSTQPSSLTSHRRNVRLQL